ncbi:unnamed protein product [Penicillium salamii]|uniref:Beta-glucuronidase C-terminal domain-containing protein n=1 Tax=Penicillium salamii TaxID=1612424 RepID=A0A9W4JYN6_9EURO|nr:unnamed protein product [Penicillium salamii]
MLSSLAAAALFTALAQADNTQHTLSIQQDAPSNATAVPADFFSFSWETAYLPSFDNDFSENIINSIYARMSKPIIIRVGGTSGDLIQVDLDQDETRRCVSGPSCPYSSQDTWSVGKSYFDGFRRFQNATMTFQAPMTPVDPEDNWLPNSMEYVRQAYNALGKERVNAIALGNEPDYYSYGVEQYVERALKVENQTIEMLGLEGEDRRIFELGDIGWTVLKQRGDDFGLHKVFTNDLNANGYGKYAAQHYYQTDVGGPYDNDALQDRLMNHHAIAERFPKIQKGIEYVHQEDNKIDFVISELGAALGVPPVSWAGGLGAGLWAVDLHLTAMSRGVKRVSNNMFEDAPDSFWIPNDEGQFTTGPSVQGIFPSAAFITDFVGKGDSLGKVVEVDVPGQPQDFSAFAMYDLQSEELARIALVNMKVWNENSNQTRGNASVTLNVGNGVESVTIKRLHSDKGSAGVGFDQGGPEHNVTWAGEQWSFKIDEGKGHFPTGESVQETVAVINGQVTVAVPDTEAVIIYIKGGLLGFLEQVFSA